jgi:hypothetical protein
VVEGPDFNTVYDSQENIFAKPLSALAKLIMPKETKSYIAKLEKYIEEAAKNQESIELAPEPTTSESDPTPTNLPSSEN